MEKSRLFLFVFSFFPGAGEMYLGMMKKGTTIMTAFFATIFVAWFVNLEELMVLLPIIFCYSFFDTHNWKRSPIEARKAEDAAFGNKVAVFFDRDWNGLARQRHTALGIGCLLLGCYLIFDRIVLNIAHELSSMFDSWIIYSMIRNIPSLVVAVLIILLGIHLLKGSKAAAVSSQDFIEYKGVEDNDGDGKEQ